MLCLCVSAYMSQKSIWYRTSLTPKEREHWRQAILCMCCGQASQFVSLHPVNSTGEPYLHTTLIKPEAPFPHQAFPPGGSHSLSTFIDSGTDANIMDEGPALKLGIG